MERSERVSNNAGPLWPRGAWENTAANTYCVPGSGARMLPGTLFDIGQE